MNETCVIQVQTVAITSRDRRWGARLTCPHGTLLCSWPRVAPGERRTDLHDAALRLAEFAETLTRRHGCRCALPAGVDERYPA